MPTPERLTTGRSFEKTLLFVVGFQTETLVMVYVT